MSAAQQCSKPSLTASTRKVPAEGQAVWLFGSNNDASFGMPDVFLNQHSRTCCRDWSLSDTRWPCIRLQPLAVICAGCTQSHLITVVHLSHISTFSSSSTWRCRQEKAIYRPAKSTLTRIGCYTFVLHFERIRCNHAVRFSWRCKAKILDAS